MLANLTRSIVFTLAGWGLLFAPAVALAQDAPAEAPAVTPQPVEISAASDGATLRGDFYAPPALAPDEAAPAVLLLHQLYATRASWGAVAEALATDGFRVLAVDLRGWGATGGDIDWALAPDDTQDWLAWLVAQPGVRGDAVFVMGASMGANLALRGCAEAPDHANVCAAAVAVSPGLNYFGVRTAAAVETGTPALIVYAEGDRRPARDVPLMLESAGANLETILFTGREHGMALFDAHPELAAEVITWMQARIPA